MTQQTIRVGDSANDRKGDSLRAAFIKVNENFTDLYTLLGYTDGVLNIGAFEFSGSTITTTDSSNITIDQSVTVSSNLTVGGDILPETANGGDLGSLLKPFRSMYVSTNTIYMGGVPLRVDANNNLTVNGTQVGGSDTGNIAFDTGGTSAGIYNSEGGSVVISNFSFWTDEAETAWIEIPAGDSSNPLRIVQEQGNVGIVADNQAWTFGSDGSMTFPTLTVPISDNANPSGTGQTIKFSDSSQQAIIYGPTSTESLVNAERIIIQGAPGYTGTAGEGGDIYLWAGPGGDTNGDGGDIKIRAGRGNGTGSGGYLYFQTGSTNTGYAGSIRLETGSSGTYGQGGPITLDAKSGGQILLRTYNSEGNSRDWIFGGEGSLTFPNGAKLNNGTSYQFATDNTVTTSLDLRDTTGRGFYTGDDGFTLRSNGTYNWIFDPTGWLKVPANTGLLGVIDEDIKIRARDYDDDGFAVVQEVLDDQDAVLGQTNLRRDEFKVEFYDGSGNLISYNRFTPTYLEIEGDIQGKYGGSTSLLVNGADSNSIVALKVIDNTDTVQGYISLKTSEVKLATDAGSSTLTFGSAGLTANTDLAIRVPSGIPSSVSNINSQGGYNIGSYTGLSTSGGTGNGLTVNASTAGNGYIDTVTIVTPGTGYTNGDTITLVGGDGLGCTFTISTSTPTWEFDSGGDLTLPASGDIVNSTGVGQLANRAEGSWTVTTGTATYSFTVPMDGTYTMWVKGNIPNGIITWNATLSVTNSNVPAIGSQYAWNYTGGGSPILLTAIPDQIRGSAGTISTDATYAGTTSNRFDFGISNTSGSSQTVYYGYIKI